VVSMSIRHAALRASSQPPSRQAPSLEGASAATPPRQYEPAPPSSEASPSKRSLKRSAPLRLPMTPQLSCESPKRSAPTMPTREPPSGPVMPHTSRAASAPVHRMQCAKTMFDDGHHWRSITKRTSSNLRQSESDLSQLHQIGLDDPPIESELSHGRDGGGGVRLMPPNLDEMESTLSAAARLLR